MSERKIKTFFHALLCMYTLIFLLLEVSALTVNGLTTLLLLVERIFLSGTSGVTSSVTSRLLWLSLGSATTALHSVVGLCKCSVGCLLQFILSSFDFFTVTTSDSFSEISDKFFKFSLLTLREMIFVCFERFLGFESRRFGFVDDLCCVFPLFISSFVALSFFFLLLNFSFAQTTIGLNLDHLFLSSSLILCAYVYDTISINIEGNFNLWNTLWCRWDTDQVEAAQ
mmetsp:Transcript_5329/g.5806  ORF Transcript_5329/g.5806 Transcript_5329/m.5806 type:complete len:226 (-) Transcript_5329:1486-2163(-)